MKQVMMNFGIMAGSAVFAVGILALVNHFILNGGEQNFHETTITFQSEPQTLESEREKLITSKLEESNNKQVKAEATKPKVK